MKAKKSLQLNLFDSISQSFEDELLIKFKDYASKLFSEGHFQLCENWWRSRFHEMLYPGHNAPKNHEEWLYRNKAEINWMIIWKRFQLEFINPIWQSR